jgi:hypothetical protein
VDLHQRDRHQREERQVGRHPQLSPEEGDVERQAPHGDEVGALGAAHQAVAEALQQLAEEREALEAGLVRGVEGVGVGADDAGQAGGEGQVVVPDVPGRGDVVQARDQRRGGEREGQRRERARGGPREARPHFPAL